MILSVAKHNHHGVALLDQADRVVHYIPDVRRLRYPFRLLPVKRIDMRYADIRKWIAAFARQVQIFCKV